MPSILDQVAARIHSAFRPQTIREFFALKLAQKLNDAAAVRHYLQLAEHYSEEQLLTAYNRTLASAARPSPGCDLGRMFQTAVARLNSDGGSGFRCDASRLLSIRVERRAVSVALLLGTQLEYVQTRQLSSIRARAENSTASFIDWVLRQFEVESAALELVSADEEIQRMTLTHLVVANMRESALPVWEIDKAELLAAYGHPQPRFRREVREAVEAIWPALPENDEGALDAAALGLHIQTERLFLFQ
jgi:hypothetical protein